MRLTPINCGSFYVFHYYFLIEYEHRRNMIYWLNDAFSLEKVTHLRILLTINLIGGQMPIISKNLPLIGTVPAARWKFKYFERLDIFKKTSSN